MRRRFLAVGLACAAAVTTLVAQADRPLPEAEAFFKATREKLAANAMVQRRFMYKERRTQLKLNPLGQMGTGPVEVFQVYPGIDEGMTYRRLLESDGKPTPPDELARQDRRFRERYSEWQRTIEREGARDREAREIRQAATRKKEDARARAVLNLFTFSIVRRDIIGGEPTIVVRFAPKPDVRATSREGRVARAFAGEAWVHETEHEVIKLEGKTVESVSFGFGMIARLNEGARVQMQARRVHGVWLPAETKFSGGGRALLVRKVDVDYVRQYFDYQPFDPTEPPPIPGLVASGRQ